MTGPSSPAGHTTRVIDVEAAEQREDARDLHISIMVRGAVQEAVSEAVKLHMPTAEERAYLGLAVRRAARIEALQRAVIEKSLTALVWAFLAFLGLVFWEYVVSHGWRP